MSSSNLALSSCLDGHKIKVMNADRVKAIRQALGITQEELGRRVGVSECTVSLWESGRRNPNGSAILLLEQEESKIAPPAREVVIAGS